MKTTKRFLLTLAAIFGSSIFDILRQTDIKNLSDSAIMSRKLFIFARGSVKKIQL